MRRIIPGLLLLVRVAAASAATSLHFGPPPRWVRPTPLPALAAPTRAAVKGLLLDRQVRFSRRTVSFYVENALRIQTPQGLSAAGTVKLIWDPDTDVLTINKVHILRGRKVIDVLGSGQTFTIARREVNLDYAAMDDSLTAILEPAGLEVGDILDVAYTLERTDPILAGTSEAEVEISPAVPITEAHVSALWPASDPVKWQSTRGLSGFQPIRAGSLAGIGLTMTDLRPIVQPKGAPLRYLIDRRVDFSSFGSWAEVAHRLAPLYERAAVLSPSSPLQAEIARIRAASQDATVRAAMALALVEDKVRYLFLGMNDGGLIPASADQTWSRRYGDCKAKTVLLLALLHGLGIDAQPVAVSVFRGDGLDARLPMVAVFDHVLVRALIGGKTYWLDGTRMGDTDLDHLHEPFYHWGLPLVSTGARLTRMLPPPLTHPRVDASIEIDARGGVAEPAPVRARIEIHGEAGVVMRTGFDNMAPTQLDTALRTMWSSQARDVKVLSVAASYDPKSAAERLTMKGTTTMHFAGGEHDLTHLGLGYEADFKRETGPNEDTPFAVLYPSFIRTTEVIELPAGGKGFTVAGSDVKETIAGMEYRRHASIDGGVLRATASVRSIAPEFPASEAAAARKSLRKLMSAEVGLRAPAGHTPTSAEYAWGLPRYDGTAADFVRSGVILNRHGKYQAALADFDAALALDSRDASALANRGIAYFWRGHKARARTDFDAAVANDPHSSVALNGFGLLALHAGDDAGAITAFTAAMSGNSKDEAFALPMRAAAYWCAGRIEKALGDYSAAIRLKPSATGLYFERALVLKEAGERAAAIKQARLVTAANPKSATAYFVAGSIYESLNEPNRAKAEFDRALTVSPPPRAQTYLARASYRFWTDLAGRRGDIEKALALDPQSKRALWMLARVQMAAGQYAEAATSLTKALRGDPNNAGMLTLRGVAYDKGGRTALAQADFSKALEGKRPAALNSVCWELATADISLATALDACNAAIAKAPTSSDIIDSRGFVLMRLGRYHQAIAAYDAALKLNPLQTSSLYGRGICELRLGERKRGQADITKATALGWAVADEFAHYGVRP